MEIWKPIHRFGGYYEISNLGRVKALPKTRGKGWRKERIMIIQVTKFGYSYIYPSINKIRKTAFIHKVVAEEFIENPNNYKVVNHIDGNKSNNIPANLEWCTTSQNMYHAYRTGLKSNKGQRNPNHKLTIDDVHKIRYLFQKGATDKELSRKYAVHQKTIYQIRKGKTWT